MNKCNVKEAIRDGFPIMMGFLPIAMAFGVLSKNSGISLWESVGFSMIVFAGASQFIALNLLVAGAGFGEIILTTLLVNFRHFLFSASLSPKMSSDIKKFIPFIAFGMTDEIFSVASLKKKELTGRYMLALEMCAYSALAIGTGIGYMLGGILPESIKLSMGIALYSLFVAILVPELKRSIKVVWLFVLSGIINSILLLVFKLPQGWSIIVTILAVSAFGLFLGDRERALCNE